MRKSMMVLIVSVFLTSVLALGGPLSIKQVSSNANWVVHANQQQFKKTQFGRLIRKELIDVFGRCGELISVDFRKER